MQRVKLEWENNIIINRFLLCIVLYIYVYLLLLLFIYVVREKKKINQWVLIKKKKKKSYNNDRDDVQKIYATDGARICSRNNINNETILQRRID